MRNIPDNTDMFNQPMTTAQQELLFAPEQIIKRLQNLVAKPGRPGLRVGQMVSLAASLGVLDECRVMSQDATTEESLTV